MTVFFDYFLLTILPFWKEFFTLISSLAWPIAIFSVAVIFRHQLSSLVARLNSLSVAGAEVSFSSQQTVKSVASLTVDRLPDIKGVEITPAVGIVETNLRKAFDEIDSGERLDRALRELALARLDTAFALTYDVIFGSQTDLLRRIREAGSFTREDISKFFESVQTKFEVHQDRSLDEYLQFLFSRELIVENEEKISLTPFGHDYLRFLYRYNMSDRLF